MFEHNKLERLAIDGPKSVLVVKADFNEDIVNMLHEGAEEEIEAWGGKSEVVTVPGALEIPTAISIAERELSYNAYVALGCVIRGETTHYETVCNESSRGIMMLGLQAACIGNGILNVENIEQAIARADPGKMNKGAEAAAAALYLLHHKTELIKRRKAKGVVRF
ncbi:MAG: 6,7-dimethyl-8-ribityllumazine synthase [Roseovarius sp.]|nr:6,7-dimethyl-8-ribityllumazine synthase [Roseovarius sp.]